MNRRGTRSTPRDATSITTAGPRIPIPGTQRLAARCHEPGQWRWPGDDLDGRPRTLLPAPAYPKLPLDWPREEAPCSVSSRTSGGGWVGRRFGMSNVAPRIGLPATHATAWVLSQAIVCRTTSTDLAVVAAGGAQWIPRTGHPVPGSRFASSGLHYWLFVGAVVAASLVVISRACCCRSDCWCGTQRSAWRTTRECVRPATG